jgi:hypothetical protein
MTTTVGYDQAGSADDPEDVGASLTFFSHEVVPPSAVALMSKSTRLPKIVIATVVQCFLCGDELM